MNWDDFLTEKEIEELLNVSGKKTKVIIIARSFFMLPF